MNQCIKFEPDIIFCSSALCMKKSSSIHFLYAKVVIIALTCNACEPVYPLPFARSQPQSLANRFKLYCTQVWNVVKAHVPILDNN